MGRGQRNAEFTGDNTDTTEGTEGTPAEASTETKVDTDRGNIGVVTVERDTEEWGTSRVRTSNNPIAIAVRDAVKGEPYGIVVDNDDKKIERVRRMLRAAAQREDVGMNIHPVLSPVGEADENGRTAQVKVRFKTGDRDKRVAKVAPEGTEVAQDTPSE